MKFLLSMNGFALIGLLALLAGLAGFPSNANASSCLPERSGYQVRDGQVVFSSRTDRGLEEVLTAADTHSFRSVPNPQRSGGPCAGLIDEYARDKQRVFFRGKAIAGADPDSFEFINLWFAKDRAAVYGLGQRLTSRVADFRLMGRTEFAVYATDGERYFYQGTIFEGEGFEFIANAYSLIRTSSKVYHEGRSLDVDVKTFEGLVASVGMSRDRNRVYYRYVPIPGADPATITQISVYLWKDKRAVYLEGREIVGLQPDTARTFPIGSEYTADANSVFRLYEKLDRDPATFAVLQPWYTKDKRGVYHKEVLIPDADPVSFVASSMSNGQDKNHRYRGNQIICKINPQAAGPAPACASPGR